jgi:hypothetical protein
LNPKAKEQREGFDALVKGLDVFGEELAGGEPDIHKS